MAERSLGGDDAVIEELCEDAESVEEEHDAVDQQGQCLPAPRALLRVT